MNYGPVNGPDGPTKGFLDNVIATAMKWTDEDGNTRAGSVIKEQGREGGYIASEGAVLLDDFR